jgi:hypothetical protein
MRLLTITWKLDVYKGTQYKNVINYIDIRGYGSYGGMA